MTKAPYPSTWKSLKLFVYSPIWSQQSYIVLSPQIPSQCLTLQPKGVHNTASFLIFLSVYIVRAKDSDVGQSMRLWRVRHNLTTEQNQHLNTCQMKEWMHFWKSMGKKKSNVTFSLDQKCFFTNGQVEIETSVLLLLFFSLFEGVFPPSSKDLQSIPASSYHGQRILVQVKGVRMRRTDGKFSPSCKAGPGYLLECFVYCRLPWWLRL